jgi:hypothetical protein
MVELWLSFHRNHRSITLETHSIYYQKEMTRLFLLLWNLYIYVATKVLNENVTPPTIDGFSLSELASTLV